MRTNVLRLSPGARAAVIARCQGRCERCAIEWPWELYVFHVDNAGPAAAASLVALCNSCAGARSDEFAPLLATPSLRDRLRQRNNHRTGADKLTAARRRRLIAERGGRCEACGVPESQRQLDIHHRVGVFRGGDDSDENLAVLCFVCHHHLQQCAAGCGRWAKKPAQLCRLCATDLRLEELRSWYR